MPGKQLVDEDLKYLVMAGWGVNNNFPKIIEPVGLKFSIIYN